ncbi:S1 family peptidase [Gigaspora margarita]|uniref:S1 family peptidase n=1 Tax=Gigaspora margarita TaxID=4874 RepID=A0A8H4B3M7_GIGMA|nr:S1 family peptidase [Gigaspora margarita]
MRVIYFLIILLISLQSYSIYAQQNHPLAKLWGISDTEVPEWLDAEKYLIMIDGILRPILEWDKNFSSSFGGTYIDIFKNWLVVNTVDYSKVEELLALPQISPYNKSLYFENVTDSIEQLKYSLQEITLIADSYDVRGALIYTNMELNNIVIYFFDTLINHTEFINAVEPFNPEIIYASTQSFSQNMIRPRRRDVNSRDLVVKVSGGDGVYNEAGGGVMCSIGCWLKHQRTSDNLYITTAGHCYDEGSDENYFYYSPWNSNSHVLPIGSIQFESRADGFYDFAVIIVENENLDPQFIIRNDDADQYRELIIINDGLISSHYAHICKSGVITHLTCGYVLGFDGVFYGIEENNNKVVELIITDLYGLSGDAGGSVFSFASSENLHSVGVHGIVVTVGPGISAVQSLDTILYFVHDKLGIFRDVMVYVEGS